MKNKTLLIVAGVAFVGFVVWAWYRSTLPDNWNELTPVQKAQWKEARQRAKAIEATFKGGVNPYE